MNKFLTFEGQQPIWLGDIDFMNNSVRESLSQLLQGLTGLASPTCILRGCEMSSTGMTAGLVVLSGEIMPVDAASINPQTSHLEIVSTFAGDRVFKNGMRHSCWEYRKAKVVGGTTGQYPIASIPHINDFITREIIVESENDITVTKVGRNYLVSGYLELSGIYSVQGWARKKAFALPSLPSQLVSATVAVGSSSGDIAKVKISVSKVGEAVSAAIDYQIASDAPEDKYHFQFIL